MYKETSFGEQLVVGSDTTKQVGEDNSGNRKAPYRQQYSSSCCVGTDLAKK